MLVVVSMCFHLKRIGYPEWRYLLWYFNWKFLTNFYFEDFGSVRNEMCGIFPYVVLACLYVCHFNLIWKWTASELYTGRMNDYGSFEISEIKSCASKWYRLCFAIDTVMEIICHEPSSRSFAHSEHSGFRSMTVMHVPEQQKPQSTPPKRGTHTQTQTHFGKQRQSVNISKCH